MPTLTILTGHSATSGMKFHKIQKLLNDSDALLKACGSGLEDVLEYGLFIRCLPEQTIVEDGKRRLRTKEDGIMNPSLLQNPSDADATYRNKAGKIHRGYVANIEESVGAAGSVVTDYRYEQNIHSDSQFLQESVAEAEISEEMATLITDGGYGGGDNTELAGEKNIDLVTTALIGKDAPWKAAGEVLLRKQNSSTEFQETLRIPKEPGKLCP